jgi:hypothetical protein
MHEKPAGSRSATGLGLSRPSALKGEAKLLENSWKLLRGAWDTGSSSFLLSQSL